MPTPPVSQPRSDEPSLRAALFAVLMALVAASAFILPRLQAKLDMPLAVIFPPWWSQEAALTSAALSGVDVLGTGDAPHILIVRTSDARHLRQLYRQGAWSVLNTGGAADCTSAAAELRT
jgi:hypothetical protein